MVLICDFSVRAPMLLICFSSVYLSDFLQLGPYLGQFLFAVLQPGLESLVLIQSFCIHLNTK